MDNSYLTTVNKFGLCSCDNANCALNRRTQVDEARHTRTEYHTSSTLQKKTEWKPIHAYFLCPHGPPPTTQSRQEHVNRARRTRKGLICNYSCTVCRHVGGCRPHEPTQVQARMTRKHDTWPHVTSLHTTHTRQNAAVSQKNTPTLSMRQMAKRLL